MCPTDSAHRFGWTSHRAVQCPCLKGLLQLLTAVPGALEVAGGLAQLARHLLEHLPALLVLLARVDGSASSQCCS